MTWPRGKALLGLNYRSKRRGRPRLPAPATYRALLYRKEQLPVRSPAEFRRGSRCSATPEWATAPEQINRVLRRRLRVKLGRDPEPSAGIVDNRSVKTNGVGGEQRGFDGGKKVRGRKGHILVDTEGLVVEARVHSAGVPDQDGIRRLARPARERLPRLSHL